MWSISNQKHNNIKKAISLFNCSQTFTKLFQPSKNTFLSTISQSQYWEHFGPNNIHFFQIQGSPKYFPLGLLANRILGYRKWDYLISPQFQSETQLSMASLQLHHRMQPCETSAVNYHCVYQYPELYQALIVMFLDRL